MCGKPAGLQIIDQPYGLTTIHLKNYNNFLNGNWMSF
jgi:hypothetical protein